MIAMPQDISTFGEHPRTPSATAKEGDWQNRLIGVTSEFSPNFASYLAGAEEAAELGVARL
jgi:putative amine oxidase (flavin-containing)